MLGLEERLLSSIKEKSFAILVLTKRMNGSADWQNFLSIYSSGI